MDAALLLIAGNETCPQPQTSEHLAAIEIMKLSHIIILQNKVDLMREEAAATHYDSIKKFIRGTVCGNNLELILLLTLLRSRTTAPSSLFLLN